MRFAAVLAAVLFSTAFGWYANVVLQESTELEFGPIQATIEYSYYWLGRTERGILTLTIRNESDESFQVLPKVGGTPMFFSSPSSAVQSAVFLPPGGELVFFSYWLPKKESLEIEISGKTYKTDLDWLYQKAFEKKREWISKRVESVLAFFSAIIITALIVFFVKANL